MYRPLKLSEVIVITIIFIILFIFVSIYSSKKYSIEHKNIINTYNCILKDYNLEFRGKIIKAYERRDSRITRTVIRHNMDLLDCRRKDHEVGSKLNYSIFGLFEYVDDSTVAFEGTVYQPIIGDSIFISTNKDYVKSQTKGHGSLSQNLNIRYEYKIGYKDLMNSPYKCMQNGNEE